MPQTYENAWKNIRFKPECIITPKSVEEVRRIVTENQGKRIKVVGGGHSMNHIFRTDSILLDLQKLNRVVVKGKSEVELQAGATLGDAIVTCANNPTEKLHFPSLGSWYSQTIAGAIGTSTHGSSLVHGSLSDLVCEVEAVLADVTVKTFTSAEPDELKAMRCHLGRLGILTKVKLKLVEPFALCCSITRHPSRNAFR